MSRPVEDLGLLEQQVLLACLQLHPNGYGVAIGDEIKLRTAKDYSPGSIYAAIERLENKSYVERRKGEASAVRGGRAKEYFTVSAIGRKALEDARQAVTAMWADLEIPELARCSVSPWFGWPDKHHPRFGYAHPHHRACHLLQPDHHRRA